MIKGPLGLMVWKDTLDDEMAVKPTDLVLASQDEVANAEVDAEILEQCATDQLEHDAAA